jgi:ParB family transcriptional regulator, chromosome partitioning protein
MAKRKRLTPPQETYLAPIAPENKALNGPFGSVSRSPAPIAQMAGDAAAVAALREVTEELQSARAEGRLIQQVPLDAIEVDHLLRDRISHDDEDMAALRASLRARGQQTPIDLVDLGNGRYGLISGWRRLMALSDLHAETGDARFSTIKALLRRPDGSADAYLAMVEENEIRVGLGHYERARIAAKAAEAGVYPDVQAALRHLFSAASRAKRSKIGSFVTLYRQLDGALQYPGTIPERLGLALAAALEADAGLGPRLVRMLGQAKPKTPAEEQSLLTQALRPAKRGPQVPPKGHEGIAPGIWLQVVGKGADARYTLSGPGIAGEEFRTQLTDWLRNRG